MEENKTTEEEQSTVNGWWQRKIFKKVNGSQFYYKKGWNTRKSKTPLQYLILMVGIFWIVLMLLVDGDWAPRIFCMILIGGPCIGGFVWFAFFRTKNWIWDIRLFEQDGVRMVRFMQIDGTERICPVTMVLEIRNKVNAYEFVLESGTRLILPRFEGETYDIRHFPNCRYLQG